MEKLLEVLSEACPDVDFENGEDLVDSGAITSFDVLSIIGELNDAFDVQIGAGDVLPENFNSAKAMWDLICRLKEA